MTPSNRRVQALSVVLAVFLAACATVEPESVRPAAADGEFPRASLKDLALRIEGEILSGNREAVFENRNGLVVDDEAVVQAIHTRAARSDLLLGFLKRGHAWEKRDGRVWILRSKEYKKAGTSRERDRDAVLVMGENRNRWTIYEGILKNSGLQQRDLPEIEAVFCEARVELLPPGIKYEDGTGAVAYTSGG